MAPVPAEGPSLLPTLHLADLACRRAGKLLFEGVDLKLPPGEIHWLRGRNGSGKTSLLRLAAGLSVPERGQVRWGGEDARKSESYGEHLVYIAHANALKDDLDPTEALTFLARIHGRDASPAAVRRALDTMGVSTRRSTPVRTLSQGQRRRVALARLALDTRPAAWLLDEPFDTLDDDGVRRLQEQLAAHRARGGSALLSSHVPFDTPDARLAPAVFDLDALAAATP
jgi:heme exporter protein A